MIKLAVENIVQYEQVFGRNKMRMLWEEFVEDAKQKLNQIETKSQEQQRLTYHSLRSSSLIFGMTEFSECCRELEEQILNGNLISAQAAQNSCELLAKSMIEVEAYLK